ncbi:MAG: hypothetical protein IJD86_07495 [Clostridia bacterium]|nr:hypothetical protein [Clostridia bacterium]
MAKNGYVSHQIAAAAISRMNSRENLEWLVKHQSRGNTRPTPGQMADMKLKGHVFYTPKYR